MDNQTPATRHLCDECRQRANGMCTTGPERFPECCKENEIMNPIEAKWETHFSPFMKKCEK